MGTLGTKRKLVSGSKHRGRFCGGSEVSRPEKIEIVYPAKSCNLVHFGQKIVRNVLHSAFLNALTMGMAFLRRYAFPFEMTPGLIGYTRVRACV